MAHWSLLISWRRRSTACAAAAVLLLTLIGIAQAGTAQLQRREDSPTDACKRYSHQTALVNGTIYIYGGQATTRPGQPTDRWNNNFLTLSVREDWATDSPKLEGLPIPDGPPKVANGYLWHDYDRIFLYGGLFSDVEPLGQPTAFVLWQYDIASGKWSEAQTSVAENSGSDKIERAAEGAGVSVPGRSLGFYFGGHLDAWTTEGWSLQTARVYLKSLLEFDMEKMQFRNVTESGLEKAGVPERADGVLVFVPWGEEGILLAIGGGTNDTFSQMNIIDVYDLGTKKWSKQATDGPSPKYRVNPCAVVASAPDGSSHNVYFFGGQNLVPYMEQLQYDDMYILTVPAFKWIKIDMEGQNVPPPRAGHTCDIVGSQLVIIGGFSNELSCDAPGIYIFDTSKLEWTTGYSAAAGGYGKSSGDGDSSSNKRPENAYKVPRIVAEEIGGDENGGATIMEPVKTAELDSPLVTGDAGDYKYTTYIPAPTILISTAADGTVTTSTVTPDSLDNSRPNIGAIVGGVVGGIVFIVILAFAGAYWLYKRKIRELRESSGRLGAVNGYEKSREAGATAGLMARNSHEPAELGESASHRNTAGSSTDLNEMMGEPTFWGVLLSPRRSLRVVNH